MALRTTKDEREILARTVDEIVGQFGKEKTVDLLSDMLNTVEKHGNANLEYADKMPTLDDNKK